MLSPSSPQIAEDLELSIFDLSLFRSSFVLPRQRIKARRLIGKPTFYPKAIIRALS
jgi:hypothetical protein